MHRQAAATISTKTTLSGNVLSPPCGAGAGAPLGEAEDAPDDVLDEPGEDAGDDPGAAADEAALAGASSAVTGAAAGDAADEDEDVEGSPGSMAVRSAFTASRPLVLKPSRCSTVGATCGADRCCHELDTLRAVAGHADRHAVIFDLEYHLWCW